MADWAELPHDMLELIVKNINLIEDFARFRSVCKSWRKIAASNKKNLRPQIPWLMLPDKPPGDDHHQIYSLSKEDIIFKNLYIPEMSDRKCIGLHYGWVLMTVTRLRGEIHLIHPISRLQIELPPQTSIEGYKEIMPAESYLFIKSAALSGNPSESSDFILMIVHIFGYVYYWRPGAKHWTTIDGVDVDAVTYYQDRFYSVSGNSDVWGFKVDHDHSIVAYQINTTKCQVPMYFWPYYIVGSTCGLLLVAPEVEENNGVGVAFGIEEGEGDDDNEGDDDEEDVAENRLEEDGCTNRYRLANFHVFEFDLISGGYKRIKSLGDRAIFVGHNTSISIDCASDFPGLKSNHIYFIDDWVERYLFLLKGGGRDMGAYSLKDGQSTPFKIEESSTRSRICPPFWFLPSL